MESEKLIQEKIEEINKEFTGGFNFIKNYQKSVTFYGSARTKPEDLHYKVANELAKYVVKELGYAVVTGGGPGIMEAANKGAQEMGGDSIGLGIKLPNEQQINKYVTDSFEFNYFFVRKNIMSFLTETYIFFPGGFGTMDELFEVLTLIQTRKYPKVPVIMVGRDYWQPFHAFVKKHMYEDEAINQEDMKIYHIVDSVEEAIEIIRRAPVRTL